MTSHIVINEALRYDPLHQAVIRSRLAAHGVWVEEIDFHLFVDPGSEGHRLLEYELPQYARFYTIERLFT